MSRLAEPPRKPVRPAAAAPPPIERTATLMVEVLEGMLAEHVALRGLNTEHRQALSSADRHAIERCVSLQQQTASRLASLEARRAALARAASAALPAAARQAGEPPISAIAAVAPEPARSRLLESAARLRDAASQTQQQQRMLRLAAQTLVAHMQGVMTQVGRALSHAGTYSRPFAATYTPQVVSALDLTT